MVSGGFSKVGFESTVSMKLEISRRALLGAAAFPATGLALASLRPPIAIVMDSGGATVSIIDMTTRKVVRKEPTLREPSHWALAPDRQRLLVSDAAGNAIFFFDPVTGKEMSHVLIPDPYQLWYSPDGRYLGVNALRLNHVDLYHADRLTLAKRFRTGSMPSHLSYSPDSRWMFNSLQGANALASFDLLGLRARWSVPVGSAPAAVMWHDGLVLVAVMGSNHVAVVDPRDGRVRRRVVTDRGPHNLFLAPDRAHIVVTNRVAGSLSVLDAKTLAVVAHVAMPGGPDDLCFAPDGKLWIALRFASEVAVFEPRTGSIDRIPVGRSPHGIFVSTLLTDAPALAAMRLA